MILIIHKISQHNIEENIKKIKKNFKIRFKTKYKNKIKILIYNNHNHFKLKQK